MITPFDSFLCSTCGNFDKDSHRCTNPEHRVLHKEKCKDYRGHRIPSYLCAYPGCKRALPIKNKTGFCFMHFRKQSRGGFSFMEVQGE